MPDYSDLIAKQKQELQEQLARLEKIDIAALETKKAKLQAEIDEIDAQIAAVLSDLGVTADKPRKNAAGQPNGILVSLNRLMELFQENKTKELNVRNLRLDTKQIKRLVDENPDTIELGGKGPWPIVKLKK